MRALAASGAALACAATLGAVALAGSGHATHPPRLVAVAVPGPTGAASVATGFQAGDDRVVTVAHVLGPGALTVDGHRARVVRVDRADDLALLAVPRLHAPPIATGSDTSATRVLVRGAPGRRAAIRRRLTAIVRIDSTVPATRRPALELAADAAPGDSGAPVVDADGHVVGVLFAASTGHPHTAYAVDGSALRALLRGA